MINLDELSNEQISQLEKQLEEYKKSKKCLEGYKVTFYVRYNPHSHDDMLSYSDEFEEWLSDAIPDSIIKSFNLKKPEDVSSFLVEKASEKELKDIWGEV
jgi:dsDNA-binding SOS-regulon protein